jgi:hypothetical protein
MPYAIHHLIRYPISLSLICIICRADPKFRLNTSFNNVAFGTTAASVLFAYSQATRVRHPHHFVGNPIGFMFQRIVAGPDGKLPL